MTLPPSVTKSVHAAFCVWSKALAFPLHPRRKAYHYRHCFSLFLHKQASSLSSIPVKVYSTNFSALSSLSVRNCLKFPLSLSLYIHRELRNLSLSLSLSFDGDKEAHSLYLALQFSDSKKSFLFFLVSHPTLPSLIHFFLSLSVDPLSPFSVCMCMWAGEIEALKVQNLLRDSSHQTLRMNQNKELSIADHHHRPSINELSQRLPRERKSILGAESEKKKVPNRKLATAYGAEPKHLLRIEGNGGLVGSIEFSERFLQ